MKVLHLIATERDQAVDKIIEAHAKGHEVKVVDLSKDAISYEDLVEDIFRHERVISW